MIPGESSAEDISTLSNDASLSIALTPEAMNLAVTPTPDGTLASDEMAIQVSTDNTTGYTLALSLAGAETSLNDPASGGKIQSSIADINSPATLSVNTWGWYPDSLANNTGNLFSALPSNSDPYELKKTSSPTAGSGETTTISFGVNVDTTLPAGSYTNAIVISAVTNYVPQPILDVYPTTGWAGDTITLYSNGGFVNVQSVQIGGTDCTSINVKSADELTCTLPDKAETDTTSGTDNGYSISVIASNTSLDTHNFTIRYFNPNRTETASVSNTQITNTNMSSFTGVDCGSLSVGDIISLTDERNGQTYQVKKMQDNKCWMVDNMKYLGEGITITNTADSTTGITYNNESGRYNTVDGTYTQSSTNSDKAFYNNPMSDSYCYGTSIQSSYTKCGYLYNWYAATAGTGTYNVSTAGNNVSGSICPSGWRLPSSYSDGSTPTGNGTSLNAADFPVLNASMNAGSLTTGSTTSYPAGWQYSGAWSGVFFGGWFNGFLYQGSRGYYWSSTALSSTYAWSLYFNSSRVYPGFNIGKYHGFAIRCVMDGVNLADDLPDTINPDNYTSSNPAVVDVYPTTGWTGDVIAITSNAQFNNVTDVTIGGTSCSPYQVISDSLIACKLPSKSANTSDGYAVAVTTSTGTVDMHNFTVRYFNPSRTETIGSSTTSNITMQNFTQSNCNAMTVGQVVSLTDSRNNQTYQVKKMQDNKCWMVDNLKYAGEANTDLANVDGTYGLVYNNESSKYNTVDGTSTQSTENFDKAFYNNPMSNSYCYGTSIQSSYTKCGYLYNWYAATAGTGTYATSTQGTNVSGSICPTGWRLPSAVSDGSTATGNGISYTAADFPVLNASMNAGSLTTGSSTGYPAGWQFTGAWSGVFSGRWYNGFNGQGSYGNYWSSTANSFTNAWLLYFGSSYVSPGNYIYSKYYGFAVRCVMEEPPAIQDFTVDECQAKASDTNFTVVDKRDGNDYTVRYINGNCWMTQNLRLAGGTTLTSTYSNVSSSYTIPTTDLTTGDSYTEGRIHNSGNTTTGYWYNYCAASAGTVCSQTQQDASYDICPKGWRLPTNSEFGTITGTSYISAFSPIYGGYYADGSLINISIAGVWWSSTAFRSVNQDRLLYYNGRLDSNGAHDKGGGIYVRCIRSS